MKQVNKLYILTWIVTACLSASLITSCDDNENESVPVITNVRLTDPATQDMSLTQAPLGVTLAIQGRNLAQVTKLFLNNYEVDLRPTYVTNSNILVTIPDEVPTIATNPDVPNTMRLETRNGQVVSYNFETLPPPAIIESISNEMAKEGEVITLSGKYFYFVNQVIFPGNVLGTNVSTAPDGSWLKVSVPAGVDQGGGHILIASNSGISSATERSHFHDSTGTILDFDYVNTFAWGIPNSNITNSTPAGKITPVKGNFGLINMDVPKFWGWSNDKVIDMSKEGMYPTGDGYDPKTAISELDVRMEVAVEEASTLAGLQLLTYAKVGDDEFSYSVPSSEAIKTTDGSWYTFSIPLSKLATNGGKKFVTYADLLKQKPHDFRLVVNNTTENDIKIIMAFDNIRIVNNTR